MMFAQANRSIAGNKISTSEFIAMRRDAEVAFAMIRRP